MRAAPGTHWSLRVERTEAGCWLWTGPLNHDGYGRWTGGLGAHCVVYADVIGPVPEGLELDHLCRNRACVNPDHLEPVTHAENVRRGESPAALHARKSECDYGHEFSVENTRNYRGRRVCRACDRRRQAKARVS